MEYTQFFGYLITDVKRFKEASSAVIGLTAGLLVVGLAHSEDLGDFLMKSALSVGLGALTELIILTAEHRDSMRQQNRFFNAVEDESPWAFEESVINFINNSPYALKVA